MMQGKIGLEEHFAVRETLSDSAGFVPQDHWKELEYRLLDIHEKRLRLMDEHGMEMMIVSLNAPAVQAIADPKKANETARLANDVLAGEIARRPGRFQGFAASSAAEASAMRDCTWANCAMRCPPPATAPRVVRSPMNSTNSSIAPCTMPSAGEAIDTGTPARNGMR